MSGTSIDHRKPLVFAQPKSPKNERTRGNTPTEIDQAWSRLDLWALQGIVAATFLVAGMAQIAGAPAMVEMFARIGIGQWFRIVTGMVEIIGAIVLVLPGLATIGGLSLGFTMLCAVATHLLVLHTSPTAAATLGFLSFLIVDIRSDELRALVVRIRG